MKVAVVFGGTSEERDVSIASGLHVIDGLRTSGHDVVAIDTARGALSSEDERQLQRFKILDAPPSSGTLTQMRAHSPASVYNSIQLRNVDVVFIALHGGSGEDGTLQALLEAARIPFTGSGHVGSTLAMDKDISKRIMQATGVPTPAWQMCSPSDTSVINTLGFPVIVKPNKQGSTVGLSLVRAQDQLNEAIAQAGQFDDEVMLEAFVPGREFTVGILQGEPLAVGEIIAGSEIFDYASKYQRGAATEIFPAEISRDQTRAIQAFGLRVHQALKLEAYSRVDFRMDEAGGLCCLEANTVPGLTPLSLLPQSAMAAGISFPDLCNRICKLALARTSH